MSFIQKTAASTAVLAMALTLMSAGATPASAAGSAKLTAGDKCTVTSGPNKGKTGTYGSDGWCEGSWGGTECGASKCKIAAKSTGMVTAGGSTPPRGGRFVQFRMKRLSTFGSMAVAN